MDWMIPLYNKLVKLVDSYIDSLSNHFVITPIPLYTGTFILGRKP